MSDKSILIGCPIYDRAWILPYWIEFIEKQDYPKENLGFIFELGPDDDSTHDLLWEWQNNSPHYKIFDAQIYMRMQHETHPDGTRVWSSDKYYNMVTLRNNLLERATAQSHQFDYYFSLDSDILLEDPLTLSKLVEKAQDSEKHVISPLMYMTPSDTNFPSAMSWVDGPGKRAARKLDQYHVGETFECDIVMAAVFMKKEVYTNARYRWHRQGEDLGFASALSDLSFRSFAAWDIYCPHIMNTQMLRDYLKTGIDGRKTI
jgi:hypothetical protein